MTCSQRFVWHVPRLWVRDFIAKFFGAIRDAVGEYNSDVLVQIKTATRRAADVKMDQVSKNRRAVRHRTLNTVNDGPSRVAPLADERFRARFHARQIIWNQEEFDGCFVLIFDNNLELSLLWNAIRASRRRFRRPGGFLILFESLAIAP